MKFPEGFVWGSASSAYQTEGAPFEDGKGASIWDSFTHRSGTIFEGDTGDVACDGYHRFEQDIALMADLGIKAYRFSVSWPRVDPKGDGEISTRGLDYYEKLVACCEKHGIAPYAPISPVSNPTRGAGRCRRPHLALGRNGRVPSVRN